MRRRPPDKDIERQALLGEAWAAWQGAEQVVDARRRHLEEVKMVVVKVELLLEEDCLEAAHRRADWFLLEFESKLKREKPDPL